MSNEAYRLKLTSRFNTLDVNDDGAITAADFEGMAARILAVFDEPAQTAKGIALMNAAAQMWRGWSGIADANSDSAISLEEYLASAERQLLDSQKGFGQVAKPWIKATLAVADKDDDGVLTYDEFSRLMLAHGSKPDLPALAEELSDEAGQITTANVEVMATAFYTRSAPSALYPQT